MNRRIRFHSAVPRSWLIVLALLTIAPYRAGGQVWRSAPTPALGGAQEHWTTPPPPSVAADWPAPYEVQGDRSAFQTIAVHAAVGTGAGLLIGLLLSGASVDDDQTTVVLTWTALGAAAGAVSGVVTWLLGDRRP